jgi:hypothetical protein
MSTQAPEQQPISAHHQVMLMQQQLRHPRDAHQGEATRHIPGEGGGVSSSSSGGASRGFPARLSGYGRREGVILAKPSVAVGTPPLQQHSRQHDLHDTHMVCRYIDR